ncbi:MAG: hypothetical protein M4579_005582 [Chaenotheca gracillima]|nr:MAG: hypothetical protein M4579_005582 [Chaenotheca gracillima]
MKTISFSLPILAFHYIISQTIASSLDFDIGDDLPQGYFPISSTPPGSYCCSRLHPDFSTHLSYPDSRTYLDEQNGTRAYWSVYASNVQPSCRLTPTTTDEVARAVAALAGLRCKFAVRGGGHMFWAGAANIQDGVTIDLSRFDGVEVKKDTSEKDQGDVGVVKVGGGARWVDVTRTLDPLGRAAVTGRVFDVGVGGLTLGGGNSWLAPRYGFVCDNVVNFEVSHPPCNFETYQQIVLASGQILDVNRTSHPSLFRALKGGGNNFGVVTRFDLRTYPQGNLWGGFVVNPWTSSDDSNRQLGFLEAYGTASGAGVDDAATIENVYNFNASGPQLIVNIAIHSDGRPDPPLLRNFTSAQPQVLNTLRSANLTNFIQEAGAGASLYSMS